MTSVRWLAWLVRLVLVEGLKWTLIGRATVSSLLSCVRFQWFVVVKVSGCNSFCLFVGRSF